MLILTHTIKMCQLLAVIWGDLFSVLLRLAWRTDGQMVGSHTFSSTTKSSAPLLGWAALLFSRWKGRINTSLWFVITSQHSQHSGRVDMSVNHATGLPFEAGFNVPLTSTVLYYWYFTLKILALVLYCTQWSGWYWKGLNFYYYYNYKLHYIMEQ